MVQRDAARKERAERTGPPSGQSEVDGVGNGRPWPPKRLGTSCTQEACGRCAFTLRRAVRGAAGGRPRARLRAWIRCGHSAGPGMVLYRGPCASRRVAGLSASRRRRRGPGRWSQCANGCVGVSTSALADGVPSMVRKPSSANSSGPPWHETEKLSTNSASVVSACAVQGLGGHADRAGVQVADPHHDAAGHHERRGGEAVIMDTEATRRSPRPAGLHGAVHLAPDAVTQNR